MKADCIRHGVDCGCSLTCPCRSGNTDTCKGGQKAYENKRARYAREARERADFRHLWARRG